MKSPNIAIDKLDNRQTKIEMDNTFIFVRNNQQKRIHLICRGQEGCLHICNHFNNENFDHSTCKQLSVSQVINFWTTRISEYKNWEQARNDLTFIATNKDVADFIKVMDTDGRLMKSLFRMGISAICPISGNLAVRHSPYVSLYILRPLDTEQQETTATDTAEKTTDDSSKDNVAEHSSTKNIEQQENKVETDQKDLKTNSKESNNDQTTVATTNPPSTDDHPKHSKTKSHKITTSRKQIIDGTVTPFDFPIFFSFIKKCFGVDPVRTFTNLAVEIENRSAFEIAHQVLAEACNNNSECIRLAYCNVDSDLVWDQVDAQYKELGCGYDSFMESIPYTPTPVAAGK